MSLAALAVAMLFALVASSAQAANWYTGTTSTNETLLTTSEPFSAEAGTHLFESGVFKGTSRKEVTVGVVLGTTPLEWAGPGFSVKPGAKIFNKWGEALSTVTVTLTGLKPVGGTACTLQGEKVEFANLSTEIVTVSGKTYEMFGHPGERAHEQGGVSGTFAMENCALAGSYQTKGTLPVEAPDIGSSAKAHTLNMTRQAEEISGKSSGQFLGTSRFVVEGSLAESLTSGRYWSAR
jgi:hypothetical protein